MERAGVQLEELMRAIEVKDNMLNELKERLKAKAAENKELVYACEELTALIEGLQDEIKTLMRRIDDNKSRKLQLLMEKRGVGRKRHAPTWKGLGLGKTSESVGDPEVLASLSEAGPEPVTEGYKFMEMLKGLKEERDERGNVARRSQSAMGSMETIPEGSDESSYADFPRAHTAFLGESTFPFGPMRAMGKLKRGQTAGANAGLGQTDAALLEVEGQPSMSGGGLSGKLRKGLSSSLKQVKVAGKLGLESWSEKGERACGGRSGRKGAGSSMTRAVKAVSGVKALGKMRTISASIKGGARKAGHLSGMGVPETDESLTPFHNGLPPDQPTATEAARTKAHGNFASTAVTFPLLNSEAKPDPGRAGSGWRAASAAADNLGSSSTISKAHTKIRGARLKTARAASGRAGSGAQDGREIGLPNLASGDGQDVGLPSLATVEEDTSRFLPRLATPDITGAIDSWQHSGPSGRATPEGISRVNDDSWGQQLVDSFL